VLPAISESIRIFLSVVLCSLAIKLLDDYLDRELDTASGEYNWINCLGEGAVAYSLPFLAISSALHPEIGVSLFLASWTVGMYRDLNVIYPSSLRGWQESLIVMAVGFCFAGWRTMICSLLLAGAVQLADDVIDRYTDQATGIRNLAHRWGAMPCCVACIAFFIGAWFFAAAVFWPVICGIIVVYAGCVRKRRSAHV
jgi:4-hydroxybenzoate polyprenyltransferase